MPRDVAGKATTMIETHTEPHTLTLEQVRQAARTCQLRHRPCAPQAVAAELNRDRAWSDRLLAADVWEALTACTREGDERAVLEWHLRVLSTSPKTPEGKRTAAHNGRQPKRRKRTP
jgi:hypothetical protein